MGNECTCVDLLIMHTKQVCFESESESDKEKKTAPPVFTFPFSDIGFQLSFHNKVLQLITRKLKTKQLQIYRILCSHGCLVSVTGVLFSVKVHVVRVGSVTVCGFKPSVDLFFFLFHPLQYLRCSRQAEDLI